MRIKKNWDEEKERIKKVLKDPKIKQIFKELIKEALKELGIIR